MFCSKCGNPLDDGGKFCGKCGAPVKSPGAFVHDEESQVDASDQATGINPQIMDAYGSEASGATVRESEDDVSEDLTSVNPQVLVDYGHDPSDFGVMSEEGSDQDGSIDQAAQAASVEGKSAPESPRRRSDLPEDFDPFAPTANSPRMNNTSYYGQKAYQSSAPMQSGYTETLPGGAYSHAAYSGGNASGAYGGSPYGAQGAWSGQPGYSARGAMPAVAPGVNAAPTAGSKGKTVIIVFAIVALTLVAIAVALWFVLDPFGAKPMSIDDSSFPDNNLRQVVSLEFDADGDGILDRNEILAIESLSLEGVSNLTGVQSFKNLRKVELRNAGGSEVVVPKDNHIEELTILDPHVNALELGKSPQLASLNIANTEISSLDLSQAPRVVQVDASHTNISTLETASCKDLEVLDVTETPIQTLDISSNAKLTMLEVDPEVTLIGIADTKLREYWLPASFSYEYQGRTTEINTVIVTYNEKGLIERIQNERSKASDFAYTYDAAGRIIAVEETGAYPCHTDITYDASGKIASTVESSNGVTTNRTYAYSDGGRSLHCEESTSEGSQSVYDITYDANGNVISGVCDNTVVYAVNKSSHVAVEYDSSGNVVSIKGRGMIAPVVEYQITWDANQRVAETKQTDSGVTYTVKYAYDQDGRLKSAIPTSDFGMSATDFTYNAQGLPTSWVVSSASDTSSTVSVSFTRFLTSDEAYAPQRAVFFGDVYPSVNTSFWDPIAECASPYDVMMQLSVMFPSLG